MLRFPDFMTTAQDGGKGCQGSFTITDKITMLVVVASLNKPMYVTRVIQDSRQITNIGMFMDGLINAFILFGAEFQSCCGG
jgi:hypothetical protein